MDELTSQSVAARTLARHVSPRQPLWALFDSAREPETLYQARSSALACESLFAGELGDMLELVAPHVAEFPIASPFAGWWFDQWGNSLGVLFESCADLAQLRRHFRTLTMVTDDERKRYFFRFYDPRVLRVFLPACNAAELRQFFGPITAFYCEADPGGDLLMFTHGGNGELATRCVPARKPVGDDATPGTRNR